LYKWYGLYEEGRTYTANRLANPWAENGVSWNRRDGTTIWTIPGGDFATQDAAATVLPDVNAWVAWDVTAIVLGWMRGNYPNYGFLIKDTVENGDANRYSVFRSRDYTADASLRPRLVIRYALVPPSGGGPIPGFAGKRENRGGRGY
jgi:hypothetical protein